MYFVIYIFTCYVLQISESGSHLRISKLKASDSGIYTCMAENVAGLDTRNITLDVMGKYIHSFAFGIEKILDIYLNT